MSKIIELKPTSYKLSKNCKRNIYIYFIRPVLEFWNALYNNHSDEMSKLLEQNQREALILITHAYKCTSDIS